MRRVILLGALAIVALLAAPMVSAPASSALCVQECDEDVRCRVDLDCAIMCDECEPDPNGRKGRCSKTES